MKPSITLRPVTLDTIRRNPIERDALLDSLATRNRAQIAAIVSRAMIGHTDHAGIVDGEARSAFMLAAARALDSARSEDDGRGKNDPLAWATWRGLNGVRDYLRTEQGEKRSPLKQRHQASLVYSSDLERESDAGVNYTNPRTYEDALAENGYAYESTEDVTLAHLGVEELLASLSGPERRVAEFMLYGASQGEDLVCPCRSRHDIARDLAETLHVSRDEAQRMVESVQVAAARVFGMVA